MTAHRARVEFTASELAILVTILQRSPLKYDAPVAELLDKLRRAERMTDR